MNEQLGIALVQHLAWPAVALIAFIGFRRNVVDLATGAGKLHDLLKNPHEILELLDKIEKAQKAQVGLVMCMHSHNKRESSNRHTLMIDQRHF